MIYKEHKNQKLKGIVAIYDNAITFHSYEENTLQPAKYPLKEDLAPLVKYIENSGELKEYSFDTTIPRNVLNYKTHEKEIIWFSNPMIKYLYFSNDLPIKNGNYPTPSLVWKLEKDKLFIYAIVDNDVKEDTILYRAPFLNVYANHSVCMGTASISKIKSTSYNQIIDKVYHLFFESVFTHTNHDELIKGSITELYQKQRKEKHEGFDNSLLIKTELTLKDIL